MLKGPRESATRPMRSRIVSLCLCMLAAASVAALAGCSDGDEPRLGRADDEEYQKALDDAIAAKNSIQSALAKAREEYEAAKAADPDGEIAKELEEKLKSCMEAAEAQRKKSEELVRGRIWKDIGEAEKRKAAEKK